MRAPKIVDTELEKIEIHLLLEGIFRQYGYDFRNYAFASVRRRIVHRLRLEGLSTVSGLQDGVMHNPEMFNRLLADLVIPVTEMFRDPDTFKTFRSLIVPELRKLPYLRVWHAGCSTGEEAYSMAILLQEEGLLDKTRIYGTDISEGVLEQAKDGMMPIERMRQYTKNYHASGGEHDFSDYYSSDHGVVLIKPGLRKNIVFARHNLVTDRSFNEFHVIFCRNVMIYFDTPLRHQVHQLFYDSLAEGGFLILGNKESVTFTPMADRYETGDEENRVYRKIR